MMCSVIFSFFGGDTQHGKFKLKYYTSQSNKCCSTLIKKYNYYKFQMARSLSIKIHYKWQIMQFHSQQVTALDFRPGGAVNCE